MFTVLYFIGVAFILGILAGFWLTYDIARRLFEREQ